MRTTLSLRRALLATLALTGSALAAFVAGASLPTGAYLWLVTGLFALRAAGQIGVVALQLAPGHVLAAFLFVLGVSHAG